MLDILVNNAKLALAAVAGAALVAGGSAVAITTVGDEAPAAAGSPSARQDAQHISDAGEKNRAATATAGITLPAPKPVEQPKSDDATKSHGCSEVVHAAQAKTAPGKARGAAVSAAAKACPKPAHEDATSTSDDAADTDEDAEDDADEQRGESAEHATSGKGKKGEHASTGRSSDDDEAADSGSSTSGKGKHGSKG